MLSLYVKSWPIFLLLFFLSCTEENILEVNFSSDFSEGTSPLTVSFENNSIGASRFIWDFDDGNTSQEENPDHVFVFDSENNRTKYNVTLTAFDDEGNSKVFSRTIYCFKPVTFQNTLKTEIDSLVHSVAMHAFREPYIAGLSIASIQGNDINTYFYGETDLGNGILPGEETTFQVLSVTKILVSASVIHLLDSIDYSLDDPVSNFLPAKLDEKLTLGGEKVTFRHLLNHTSGLPKEPSNLAYERPNPYAFYDSLDLYNYIEENGLVRTPGTIPRSESEYENFFGNTAYGLLGIVLMRTYKKSLQEILSKDFLSKMDLNKTFIGNIRSVDDKAFPHRVLYPRGFWVFEGMEGCCGLNSNLKDLIKFSNHLLNLDFISNPSDPLVKTFDSQYTINELSYDFDIGLPWEIRNISSDANPIYIIEGCSFGYTVHISLDLVKKRALVIMSNNACDDPPIEPLIEELTEKFH